MKIPARYFLLFLQLVFLGANAQNTTFSRGKHDGVYFSAGVHLGFTRVENYLTVPFQMHFDKQLKGKAVLGLGYSFDQYVIDPTFGLFNARPAAIRHNIRLRFYSFLGDPNQTICSFFGGSAGISEWREYSDGDPVVRRPSGQILFGVKVKLADYAFWVTEASLGAPYAFQSSVGFFF